MKIYKFYDTSSLLTKGSALFDNEDSVIVISSISLKELEEIKVSNNKDNEIKARAREVIRTLDQNPHLYETWIFNTDMLNPIISKDLPLSNDMKILATAIDYDIKVHPDETVFISNDISLRCIANLFFGEDSIGKVEEEKNEEEYTGFKIVYMNNEEMADFY